MSHINLLRRYAKFFLLLLAVGMYIFMMQFSNTAAPVPPAPTALTASVPKVVFFGSSTTVGVGASRGDRRWTTLLSRYLNWQEINEGLSGSTITKPLPPATSRLSIPAGVERWQEAVVARHPDLVVMMYGVNDTYRRLPLDAFQRDVKTVLTQLRSRLPNVPLIVSTPQPNRDTLERRLPYDLALQEGARQVGAKFVDAGREAFATSELPDYSADGLHLNNLGHAALAAWMAGKIVDLGLVPAPPAVAAGDELAEKLVPLPGGYFRIDLDNPLKFGEIRAIEAQWMAAGTARFAIVRPSGRDGYEIVYRTPHFAVSSGRSRIAVPRWWVLDGDRLAVWTEGDCLGASEMPLGTAHHLSFAKRGNGNIPDLSAKDGSPNSQRLAIRINGNIASPSHGL
jgi:lysophospholipase L1-like esterase